MTAGGKRGARGRGTRVLLGGVAVVLCLCMVATSNAPASQPKAAGTVIPNHYIVVLEDSVAHPANVAEAQAEKRNADVGLVYRSALKGYSVTMSKSAAKALERDPRVKHVTPDRTLTVDSQTTPTGVERSSPPPTRASTSTKQTTCASTPTSR